MTWSQQCLDISARLCVMCEWLEPCIWRRCGWFYSLRALAFLIAARRALLLAPQSLLSLRFRTSLAFSESCRSHRNLTERRPNAVPVQASEHLGLAALRT